MSQLKPEKLHVSRLNGVDTFRLNQTRRYTLTHSDATGDLFLKIGSVFDVKAISGWYARLMRDEVLAELLWNDKDQPELHVMCHVSGGLIIGSARWRFRILQMHMPLVLEAICWGDRDLLQSDPDLERAPVWVHFQSNRPAWNKIESWGCIKDHIPGEVRKEHGKSSG